MTVQLNPYLNFSGNGGARQAMEFYRAIFGGTLEVSTYGEFHISDDPADADKVMHAQLNGDNGIVFMASDMPDPKAPTASAVISMSLSGDDHALLSGYFAKLSETGTVTMPLEKAPWGDTFGACVDKFGISWMVNISPAAAA